MIAHLESIQTKCSELREDPDCLDGVLCDGAISLIVLLCKLWILPRLPWVLPEAHEDHYFTV